jgi:methylglyoxal synthase
MSDIDGGAMLRLAVIAHDNKKVDLVARSTFNRDTLAQFTLAATGHTAQLMRDKVGLEVEPLLSGPLGGDAQIAARVAEARIDAVFFFVDPLSAQPHDPDIRALLRVCNVHNVPLATNLASADLIIAGLAAGLRPRGAASELALSATTISTCELIRCTCTCTRPPDRKAS